MKIELTDLVSFVALTGEHDSACHGSVLEGQFEGSIHTGNVTYHIEAAHRYNITDHHSIIYREDDMGEKILRVRYIIASSYTRSYF